MAMSVNPYIAGNPVGNTPAFVGREDVLREVVRVLCNASQNAITLYGQRRIGKTGMFTTGERAQLIKAASGLGTLLKGGVETFFKAAAEGFGKAASGV